MESDMVGSSISNLTPTEFESLTYDTLAAVGLRNLVWRMPGADGGRDIEGEAYIVDLTGHGSSQVWYIECKRYQASIDWPTIWKKIAYADSDGADVFLLSTNSNPSPGCETEITKWNSARRRPVIRVWRSYEWRTLLVTYPDIALSYGVGQSVEPHDAIRPIATLLTQIVQSAHMTQAFGQDSTIALEASAALSELITKRLADLDRSGRFVDDVDPFVYESYSWLKVDKNCALVKDDWDVVSLRAVLSYVRYLVNAKEMTIMKFSENELRCRYQIRSLPSFEINDDELKVLCRWSRLRISLSQNSKEFKVEKYG